MNFHWLLQFQILYSILYILNSNSKS